MRRFDRTAAMAPVTLFAALAFAGDTRMVGLAFEGGAETARIADEVKGDQSVMYRFRAKNGQSIAVVLNAADENTDFILYGPGRWPGTVMHDSAASGSRQYSGASDRDGPHAVLVSRAPGRDKAAPARFDLTITLSGAAN